MSKLIKIFLKEVGIKEKSNFLSFNEIKQKILKMSREEIIKNPHLKEEFLSFLTKKDFETTGIGLIPKRKIRKILKQSK